MDNYFSIRAFLQATIISALLMLGFYIVAYRNANQTIDQIETTLSHRTISVKNLNFDTKLAKDLPTSNIKDTEAEALAKAPELDDIVSSSDKGQSLYPAPIKGLFEVSPTGPLPIISSNQITPFDAYKKPYTPGPKPQVIITIKDFGLSATLSEKILETLPSTITLLISPYAKNARTWQTKAREKGFETWMFIPTQNDDIITQDIGSIAIMTTMSYLDNKDRINTALSRASGYAGVAMETDKVMSTFNPFQKILKKDIFGRGLGFFEINPNAGALAKDIANQTNMPYFKNTYDINKITLQSLEAAAKQNSYALAVIKPYPRHINQLEEWAKTHNNKSISIAPLSALQSIARKKRIRDNIKNTKTAAPQITTKQSNEH